MHGFPDGGEDGVMDEDEGEYETDQVVGVAAIGDWSFIVEPNGVLGVSEQVIQPLSRGTTLVSHYRNVNGATRFFWVQDGDIRTRFEPYVPDQRWGSDPDALVDVMRQVGFRIGTENADSDEDVEPVHSEAAFALAEHLTGVRLTAAFLETATYLCAVVPMPVR
jgi:hypothetical protein